MSIDVECTYAAAKGQARKAATARDAQPAKSAMTSKTPRTARSVSCSLLVIDTGEYVRSVLRHAYERLSRRETWMSKPAFSSSSMSRFTVRSLVRGADLRKARRTGRV